MMMLRDHRIIIFYYTYISWIRLLPDILNDNLENFLNTFLSIAKIVNAECRFITGSTVQYSYIIVFFFNYYRK